MKYGVRENEAHENSLAPAKAWNLSKLMAFYSTTLRDGFEQKSISIRFFFFSQNKEKSRSRDSAAIVQCIWLVAQLKYLLNEIKKIFRSDFVERRDEQEWTEKWTREIQRRSFWIHFDFLWFYCTNLHDSRGKCFLALTQTFYYDFFVCNLCVCCIA